MAKIPRSQVTDAISKLSKTTSEDKLAKEIAAYLLETNRTGELDSLARDLVTSRVNDGIVEVTAVSAHQLASATIADIEAKIRSLYPAVRQIIINQRLDANEVGGVRLEFPDKQLDLSVRNKLNKFKQLTGATNA